MIRVRSVIRTAFVPKSPGKLPPHRSICFNKYESLVQSMEKEWRMTSKISKKEWAGTEKLTTLKFSRSLTNPVGNMRSAEAKVNLRKELVDAIENWIRNHPEAGYLSVDDLASEAVRLRFQELKQKYHLNFSTS